VVSGIVLNIIVIGGGLPSVSRVACGRSRTGRGRQVGTKDEIHKWAFRAGQISMTRIML